MPRAVVVVWYGITNSSSNGECYCAYASFGGVNDDIKLLCVHYVQLRCNNHNNEMHFTHNNHHTEILFIHYFNPPQII